MTQALAFGQAFIAACQALVADLENLRTLNDHIANEAPLLNAYVTAPGARADIQLADLQAASAAVTQILFTFDSGTPATKEAFFKLE
jgi:hypothetical protein